MSTKILAIQLKIPACKNHMIVSQQKWLAVPFVHGIGETRQHSSANHNRLAIIVYNIRYSALSNPMNILSTVGGFWANEVSRAR